jgi:hypothetical protein
MMNLRLIEPDLIVDLNALPLDYIHRVDGHLVLGALVRHHMLEEREEVRAYCPLFSEAATFIGNVRVRSLGTVGGSLAHADPAAELPMASLALDAEFTLQGPGCAGPDTEECGGSGNGVRSRSRKSVPVCCGAYDSGGAGCRVATCVCSVFRELHRYAVFELGEADVTGRVVHVHGDRE